MDNGTDKWYLSGVLGIGTNEPGKMLHIQGSSSAPLLNDSYDRPGLAITGSYPELDLFSEANNPNHGPTIRLGSYNNDNKDSFKQWVIGTSGRNSSFLDIGFSNRNDPNPHAGIRNHNGTTLFTILENGNVGIGTTTPKAHLEIMQTFSTSLPFQPVLSIVTRGLRFLTESAGGVINSCDSDGTVRPLTLQKGGGNVGIGTTNPTHPLHVKTDWGFLALDSNAAGQDSGVRLMEGGAVKWHIWNSARDAKFYLARDGLNETLALDQSGNVDIGLNPLRISSGWTGSPDAVTNRAEISNDTGEFKTLMIVGNNSAGMGRRVSVWDRLEVNGDVVATGLIGNKGYSPQPRNSGWGGGIHTWDVEAEGSIWCANYIYGKGGVVKQSDLAEIYFSDEVLEAGDVVCLHPIKDCIVKSKDPTDVLVFGVISTEPGLLMNSDCDEEKEGNFPVALCGRVPCKVTDENGPIKRGDMLCSSSKAGHAMKAQLTMINNAAIYHPGTIIGKALGVLESGTGIIDIFVFPG